MDHSVFADQPSAAQNIVFDDELQLKNRLNGVSRRQERFKIFDAFLIFAVLRMLPCARSLLFDAGARARFSNGLRRLEKPLRRLT